MTELANVLASRYRVIEEIGEGGMGTIFLAEDMRSNRRVAIKLLSTGTRDALVLKRFRNEAAALQKLSHPNIVECYGIEEDRGFVFLVMEHVSGTDIAEHLRRSPNLMLAGLPLFIQVCSALEYVHSRGIIHRDIKPENILVTAQGTAKLIDFGLAKDTYSKVNLTAKDMMLGTLIYISPEMALNAPVGPAADLYSLGVSMYEIFTGKRPFESASAVEFIRKVAVSEPVSPKEVNPAIPARLDALLMRMMHKTHYLRPPGARAVAEELERILEEMKTPIVSETIPEAAGPPIESRTVRPGRDKASAGPGDTIGDRYLIGEVISAGRHTTVFRATDGIDGAQVAVKEFRFAGSRIDEEQSVFLEECRRFQSLRHPAIPRIIDFFAIEHNAYLVRDHVQGKDLHELYERAGEPAPQRFLLDWIRQAADILEYLHTLPQPELCLVMNPSHLILHGGTLRLINIGPGRSFKRDAARAAACTLHGTFAEAFCAVEQIGSGITSPQSDVFSLGATAYYLLTAKLPPSCLATLETAGLAPSSSGQRHASAPAPPSSYSPFVTRAMDAAVLKSIELLPPDRWSSVREFIDAFFSQ
jgi:serine/threonine protein kinase